MHEDKNKLQDELSLLDKRVLDIIQTKFPLEPRPYLSLATQLGVSEKEVFECIQSLKNRKIIRRLGANFQSHKLGFSSTLCAAKVPDDKLQNFIEIVNSYQGVTHNYLRKHKYNIWFTLIAPSKEQSIKTLDDISEVTGIKILNLPAKKLYKIKVDFAMQD